MVIAQGEIWWAGLGDPIGSASGYRRPVVIVQCDALNRSRIATALCVPLMTNLKWATAPGNILLDKAMTGLDHDSVANVSLTFAIDRTQLIERAGRVEQRQFDRIASGIGIVLGR